MAKTKRVSPIRALLADYYTKQTGEKITIHSEDDQQKLDQFLQVNKNNILATFASEIQDAQTVKEILRLHTRDAWAELLIGVRKKYGLDSVPLKDVLSMIEYDGAHGHKLINGKADNFIASTIHQHKYQVDLRDMKVPGVDHTIHHQLDTWVAELVSNALDATVPEHSIGKFGSGFLSCLSTLGKEADTISVITKKQGGEAYKLVFTQQQGEIFVHTDHIKDSTSIEPGTSIVIQRNGIPIDDDALMKQLSWKFSTNTTAPIIINNIQINNTKSINWSKPIDLHSQTPVILDINSSCVIVKDHGVGMDAHGLLYHLLFPKSGTKQPVSYTDHILEKMITKEVCYGYEVGDTKYTTIRCQVAGVTIESFDVPKQGNIAHLSVILPSVTYLPEARNQIIGTKEVLLSLKHILYTITQSKQSLQTKVDLLGSFAHIIRIIDERRTTEGQSKELSLTTYAQKEIYPILAKEISQEGRKILQADTHVQNIVGQTNEYIFVDSLFLGKINPLDLPGAKKVDTIITEKIITQKVHGKNIPFYSCTFDEHCPYDYVLFPHCVIINEKYITNDTHLALLNTAVNLNIGYELEGEKVYYGTIITNTQYHAQELETSQTTNTENRENLEEKKVINTPEIIERFYTEIVDQIDIEYNGLWSEMCKRDHMSDKHIEEWIEGIPLNQYLVDDTTKDRCMQMIIWSMTTQSGWDPENSPSEVTDITFPLPDNAKYFIAYMKSQPAEYTVTLSLFLMYLGSILNYTGHSCYEEIALLFKIIGEEQNPVVMKQLMGIIRRYLALNRTEYDKPFDIFKKLNQWKRHNTLEANTKIIKKNGLYADEEYTLYHPNMSIGNVVVKEGKTISIARTCNGDCTDIEAAFEKQGMGIYEFNNYADAIDFFSDTYLQGKEINKSTIHAFLDSIGHSYHGYMKSNGKNRFGDIKNRYLRLPIKIKNKGLLFIESNDTTGNYAFLKKADESYGDAYPILSEYIIEEIVTDKTSKKETIEELVKELSFLDIDTGVIKDNDLEHIWDLLNQYDTNIFFDDDNSWDKCKRCKSELREKYGINIDIINSNDISDLIDVITNDDNTLYERYQEGDRTMNFSEYTLTESQLATAYRTEQTILYQYLLHKKRQEDPTLVDIHEEKERDYADFWQDLRMIINQDVIHQYIDRELLTQRLGTSKLHTLLMQPTSDVNLFWNLLSKYSHIDQQVILGRLLYGYNTPDKDRYEVNGVKLTNERWWNIFYKNANDSYKLELSHAITLVQLINEVNMMKKEYEENKNSKNDSTTPDRYDLNDSYRPLIYHALGMKLCDHLYDILGFTTKNIDSNEARNGTEWESYFNSALGTHIDWKRFAWDNAKLIELLWSSNQLGDILYEVSGNIKKQSDKIGFIKNFTEQEKNTYKTDRFVALFIQAIVQAEAITTGKMIDVNQEKKEKLLEYGWIYCMSDELADFLCYIFQKNGLPGGWNHKLSKNIFEYMGKKSMFYNTQVNIETFVTRHRNKINTLSNGYGSDNQIISNVSGLLLYCTPEQVKVFLQCVKNGDEADIDIINGIIQHVNERYEKYFKNINMGNIRTIQIVLDFFQALINDRIETPLVVNEKSLVERYYEKEATGELQKDIGSTMYLEKLFDVIFYTIDDTYIPKHTTFKKEIADIFDLETLGTSKIHSIYTKLCNIASEKKEYKDRLNAICFMGNELYKQVQYFSESLKTRVYTDILAGKLTSEIRNILDKMLGYGRGDIEKRFGVYYYVLLEQAILEGNKKNKNTNTLRPKEIVTQKISPEQFFNTLYREHPQDLVAFAQFLYAGGTYLIDIDSEATIETHTQDNEFLLSELIATSNTQVHGMQKIQTTDDINRLITETREEGLHTSRYHQRIRSAIDGQDRGSMIFLRELVQNARDVILKNKKQDPSTLTSISTNFGKEGDAWITKVSDPIGMSPFEVWNYLLPIFVSGKKPGESTGMFGQGFYSTMVGAKEVRIKTSKGNGEALYVTMKPIYQHTGKDIHNNQIIDFTIITQTRKEQYIGTTIERIDQQEGILSNLIAMLGVNQLQKYVGAVDDVAISFNGNPLLKPDTKKIEQIIMIPGYGDLELLQIKDGVPRLMKDNLYIKEIDDQLLACFPDWIAKIIRDKQLCINLPTGIQLNKTRNDLMQKDNVYKNIIQPYLFRVVMEYILNEFCHNGLKIPMLPEDYLYNRNYVFSEGNNSDIFEMVSEYNLGENSDINAHWWERGPWRNKRHILNERSMMANFLVGISFTNKGNKTSLRSIRNDLLAKHFREVMEANVLSGQRGTSMVANAQLHIETSATKETTKINLSQDLDIPQERIDAFFAYQQKLTDALFGTDRYKVAITHEHMGELGTLAYYRNVTRTVTRNDIYLVRDRNVFLNFDKDNSKEQRYMLEILSHELSHHVENILYDKRSTHEKDVETDISFESIQREIVTKMLRGEPFIS